MKTTTKALLFVSVGVVVLFVLMLAGIYLSCSNKEIGLRNQIAAQQDQNRVIFDKTWKVVSQMAQLPAEYASKFEKIYLGIMDARYGKDDGTLFKWIQESNPNFSTELYARLGDAIEGNRAEFATVQSRLRDLKREHDNIRLQFPGSLFLSGRPAIEVKLVTSAKTEEAFSTGKDENTELFNKGK